MNARWWLLLERAQATLPLIVAGALGAFTWWLVQSSPKEGGPRGPAQASSEPDYWLNKARIARFDAQGHLEALLDGDVMRHYPDTDRLHIDKVTLSARDKKGQGVHAVANEGEADHRSEVVTLRGDARIVSTPPVNQLDQGSGLRRAPLHFAGEGLRIDTRSRVVTSSDPVLLTQENSQVQAQSMSYDDDTHVTELHGRVRGRYEAPPTGSASR